MVYAITEVTVMLKFIMAVEVHVWALLTLVVNPKRKKKLIGEIREVFRMK